MSLKIKVKTKTPRYDDLTNQYIEIIKTNNHQGQLVDEQAASNEMDVLLEQDLLREGEKFYENHSQMGFPLPSYKLSLEEVVHREKERQDKIFKENFS